jgi:hypothetical protein
MADDAIEWWGKAGDQALRMRVNSYHQRSFRGRTQRRRSELILPLKDRFSAALRYSYRRRFAQSGMVQWGLLITIKRRVAMARTSVGAPICFTLAASTLRCRWPKAVTAPLLSCRMGEQLTNAHPAARLKTSGRWEGDSVCQGNGVTAARPCSPSVRSSMGPAGIASLEAKIDTLQAEIAKLEAIVAGSTGGPRTRAPPRQRPRGRTPQSDACSPAIVPANGGAEG